MPAIPRISGQLRSVGRRGRRPRRLWFIGLLLIGLVIGSVGLAGVPARADDPTSQSAFASSYGFETGTAGFVAGSGVGNAGTVTTTTQQHHSGSHALAMPVSFAGGSWDEATTRLDFGGMADLSHFGSVTVHVHLPQAGDLLDIGFGNPVRYPSRMITTTDGWTTASFDIGSASTDFVGGVSSAASITVRVVGRYQNYSGTVAIDDLTFGPLTAPGVVVKAPHADTEISTPAASSFTVDAAVVAPPGRSIASVTWVSGHQHGALAQQPGSDRWTGLWDLWKEPEGVTTLTLTATDSTGMKTTVPTRVQVRNSLMRVTVTNPIFDQTLSGRQRIRAKVTPDPRYPLRRAAVAIGSQTWPLSLSRPASDGTVVASAVINTRDVDDGAVSAIFRVSDTQFSVRAVVGAVVRNTRESSAFVTARNGEFRVGHKTTRFVGGNNWVLPYYTDTVTDHLQVGADGAVIAKGTALSWQHQVDQDMLSAERSHLTWLRVNAYNDNPSDPAAFRTGLTDYNEAAFRRLDYVLASARRHNIRLTLVLTNNWPDYGGIHAYAQWLGLKDDNAFFTDSAAINAYRSYAKHVLTRTNTVTGKPYRDDPTIFSYELANEPRYPCTENACDESGHTLRTWIADQSAYLKSLDPHHMVSAGSEGHGLLQARGGDIQWAGQTEGLGNDPFLVQNMPSVDFFTFHPYLNAGWFNQPPAEAKRFVRAFVKQARALGKPIVMEEYGFDRNAAIYADADTVLQPGDAGFTKAWAARTRQLVSEFYAAGGNGTGIWALTNTVDASFSVNLYLPEDGVKLSRPVVNFLSRTGERLGG